MRAEGSSCFEAGSLSALECGISSDMICAQYMIVPKLECRGRGVFLLRVVKGYNQRGKDESTSEAVGGSLLGRNYRRNSSALSLTGQNLGLLRSALKSGPALVSKGLSQHHCKVCPRCKST